MHALTAAGAPAAACAFALDPNGTGSETPVPPVLHRTYLLRQVPAIKPFLAESQFAAPLASVFPTFCKIKWI
ncbi:hypothetical protein WNZ15_07575 [Roseibium sp. AS2]|uniref:hypothetical protein n=1 Tax=Roseibium sp. AS2 TaxID=3135781 RepID=UPI003180D7BA